MRTRSKNWLLIKHDRFSSKYGDRTFKKFYSAFYNCTVYIRVRKYWNFNNTSNLMLLQFKYYPTLMYNVQYIVQQSEEILEFNQSFYPSILIPVQYQYYPTLLKYCTVRTVYTKVLQGNIGIWTVLPSIHFILLHFQYYPTLQQCTVVTWSL